MSRARLIVVVTNDEGVPVEDALVTLYEFGTETPLAATVYRTVDGATTYTPSQRETDAAGRFEGWLTRGQRVTSVATKAGLGTLTTTEDVIWDPGDVVVTVGLTYDAELVDDASMSRSSAILNSAEGLFTAADVGKRIRVREASGEWTTIETAAISSGTDDLTSSDPAWTSGDVGKVIEVAGAGAAGATLTTTISAFVSSTAVTIATNASTTVGPTARAAWASPVLETTVLSYDDPTQVTLTDAATVAYVDAEADWGTDNSAVLQAAIDALPASGGTLRFTGTAGDVAGLGAGIDLRSKLVLSGDGVATLRRLAGNTDDLLEASSAITDLVVKGLVLDHRHGVSGHGKMFEAPANSHRVSFEHTRFINLGNGQAWLLDTGATKSSFVKVQHCRFERTLPRQGVHWTSATYSENTGTFALYDASETYVEHNVFTGTNGIGVQTSNATACPATAPMDGVYVRHNKFFDCHATTLTVGAGVASSYMAQAYVDHNSFTNCGLTMEKGAVFFNGVVATGVVVGGSVSFNTIRHTGYAESSGGYSDTNPGAVALNVGGGATVGVNVVGNTLDGSALDGTLPAGEQIGMRLLDGFVGGSAMSNYAKNLSGPGILLDGVSNGAGGVRNVSLIGNNIDRCVLVNNSRGSGGIHLHTSVTGFAIVGNTVARCGSSTAAAHAAGIAISDTATSGSGVILGNTCYDDQGTPRQLYGVRIGRPSGAADPTTVTVIGNNVQGNVTAGLFYTPASTLCIRDNPGANEGATPLVDVYTRRRMGGSKTHDWGDIANGAQETTTVTVTGAALGDKADAYMSISLAGIQMTAYVSAADTVTVVASNTSGGNINLGSGTLVAIAERV